MIIVVLIYLLKLCPIFVSSWWFLLEIWKNKHQFLINGQSCKYFSLFWMLNMKFKSWTDRGMYLVTIFLRLHPQILTDHLSKPISTRGEHYAHHIKRALPLPSYCPNYTKRNTKQGWKFEITLSCVILNSMFRLGGKYVLDKSYVNA